MSAAAWGTRTIYHTVRHICIKRVNILFASPLYAVLYRAHTII